jgi:hypothetical protein
MTLAYKVSDSSTPNTPAAIAAQIQQLLAELQQDAANLASLQAQLAALKAQSNPPATKAEIDAMQQQVNDAQSKLTSDTATDDAQINKDTAELQAMNLNEPDDSFLQKMNKFTLKSGEEHFTKLVNLSGQTESAEEQIAQQRADTFQAINNYATLTIDYGNDALQRLANITQDQEDIDSDEAQEKTLKDEIIEDSIKAGALWIFGGEYYAYKAAQAADELSDVEADESAKKADMAVQQAALADDLAHLFAASEGSISTEIKDLFTDIQKIISIVQSGGNSESSMQQVSVLLAEVMSIVQMITTQIQQLRSQDDQWMSRANADQQEVAANKSKVDAEQIAALQDFSSFMKTVMEVAKYGMEAASVAGAVFSGGATMIAMAAIMVICTEAGLFDMATNALANAMSKNPPIWLKVLADVMVTVASIVITHTASAALSQVGSAVAKAATTVGAAIARAIAQGTNQAVDTAAAEVEVEMTSLVSQLEANAATAGKDLTQVGANAASNASKTTIQKFVAALKVVLNKQNAGLGLAYFGATGGVVDLSEMFAAMHTNQLNKTKEELEQQEMFQIIQLVMSVVQAVVEMAGTGAAASASGGTNKIAAMLEANLPRLMQIITALMAVSSMASAGAAGSLTANSYFKAKLVEDVGTADSNTSVYKSLGQMQKLYDQKEIELFSSKLQQMISEVSIMINKFGQAEDEVAKLLQQSAV